MITINTHFRILTTISYLVITGDTPLLLASSANEGYVVSTLLKNKSDVNIANDSGRTALYYAVLNDNLEVARTLISSGADCNIMTNDYRSVLTIALGEFVFDFFVIRFIISHTFYDLSNR